MPAPGYECGDKEDGRLCVYGDLRKTVSCWAHSGLALG
jgi:hypothetical protein